MRVLGIHILKGQLRFTLLTGTKGSPSMLEKGRYPIITTQSVPALMNWYDNNFRELILRLNPDKIAYRITLDPNKEQLFNVEFPYGILNLICYEQNIEIIPYVQQNYTPSKLNREKNIDLYELCEEVFGDNPPYWDKHQMNSLLIAWFELPSS